MHTDTRLALENMTDFVAFEMLCCDLLSCYGNYAGIVPQGVGRIDGGKDAILIKRNVDSATCSILKKIVFHFSLRQDYERKFWEDMEKVKKKKLKPTHVVFVTNRSLTAGEQDKLIGETKKKYGWDLDIWHQKRLCVPLDTNFQDLRRNYLSIDFDLTIFEKLDVLLRDERKRPNRVDFEQGVYYRNDILHDAIHDKLKNKRRCLIIGKPGSGKTALARGIGYDFIKESSQDIVFYLSADKNPSSNEWLQQIKRCDHPYVLYIIDNCHNAIEAVNDLIERWFGIKNARVLFISRSINPDLAGTKEESYLEGLKSETIPLDIDKETVYQIVQHFTKREDIKEKEIGDTEIIFKKCEGDLHLLNFFVDAWVKERAKFKYLSDVDEKAVLDNVYSLYLEKKQHAGQLLAIATLSQFEIPVEGRWIGNYEVVDSIQKDAWVEKFVEDISGTPIVFLQYFHSTPASYILKAAFEKGMLGKPLDSFIIERLEQYLSCKPSNFFDVFSQLYKNDRNDLQYKLFQKEDTFKVYEELISNNQLLNISKFLWVVWVWEERKKDGIAFNLLQKLRERMGEKEWKEFSKNTTPRAVVMIVSFFKKIDSKIASDILLSLDIKALGEQSRDVGLATVQNFLQLTTQAGVKKEYLKAFCDGLDFKDLGERSRDVGLATVRTLLQLTTQAGVDKGNLKAYCDGLDFKALGERSKDVGLANVQRFLQLTTQAGVKKEYLKAFCDGLDFRALGERSRDVGLATVSRFLQLTTQAGVEEIDLNAFCSALDWEKFGQSAKDEEGGIKNLLFTFRLFLKVRGITKGMAQQFVEGIGWESLRKEIKDNMSPDILVATRIFLMQKCELSPAELNEKKIDLRPSTIWFRSFINSPCPKVEEGQKKWRANYLKDALNRLLSQNLENLLRGPKIDLKAWNVFILNMLLAGPTYIDKKVVPILRSFTTKQYENLFFQSDLQNISTFLNRFNPRDGIFKWALPNGINFQKLDFMNKVQQSPIYDIAHFLFNFYFIGRSDLCNHFAELLEKSPEKLQPKVEAAELKELEFFLWNLWMALPDGVKPSLFQDGSFIDILIEKSTQEKEDQENILGFVGLLKLSCSKVPTKLAVLIRPDPAKQLCLKAVKADSVKSIRLLGGLSTVLPDIPSDEKKAYLNALDKLTFDIKVPNQDYALNLLRAWLVR